MDLDPSQDNLEGPLTPASQGMDEIRVSMEEDDQPAQRVKFSSGVRELTPQEIDPDHAEEVKVVSADDCINSGNGIVR